VADPVAAILPSAHRMDDGALLNVLRSQPDPVIVVDAAVMVIWANPAAEVFFGLPLEEAVGVAGLDLVHPDDVEFAVLALLRVDGDVAGLPTAIRVRSADGWRLVEVIGAPIVGSDGAVVLAVRDLTERRRYEVAGDDVAMFRSLMHNAATLTMLVSDTGDVRATSGALARVLGHDPELVIGQPLADLVEPDDRIALFIALDTAALAPQGAAGATTVELRLCRQDGSGSVAFELTIVNLLEDPTVGGFVASGRDITTHKQLEEELAHQALHDSLTDLANQSLFRDRVEHALARLDHTPGRVAVLFLDLDNFKNVNDSLGHSAGDELLIGVSQRLKLCLRVADTAARLGGDEFAILLEDAGSEREVIDVAERLLDSLQKSFTVGTTDVSASASIGIAMSPLSATCDQLLRNADLAMYTAKRHGRGRFELFQPEMHAAAVERLNVEAELRRAIERDELVVYYQPIVELRSSHIIGVEALVRWNHPTRGLLGPDVFIGLAEETGLIHEIDSRVLARACKQVRRWQYDHIAHQSLEVSVNLAPRQLLNAGLIADVEKVLSANGLEPGCLILEITEGAMMRDAEAAIENLHALKALGVRLAVDDFGTGYSSLTYLQRFPIDILKIDRSFIESIDGSSEDAALAHAIIRLAETLHLTPIAEGVERETQRARLIELGCELAQGFHFARPAPAADITALLADDALRRFVGPLDSLVLQA
jgi:diguanylate cyclase (GGDEF)-like protein/PAS domain S-box-containing protein